MNDAIDIPVAPGPFHDDDNQVDPPTPAQRRCNETSQEECDSHLECSTCPAYQRPGHGSRA